MNNKYIRKALILEQVEKYLLQEVSNPNSKNFQNEEFIKIIYLIQGKDYKERWIEQQKGRNR